MFSFKKGTGVYYLAFNLSENEYEVSIPRDDTSYKISYSSSTNIKLPQWVKSKARCLAGKHGTDLFEAKGYQPGLMLNGLFDSNQKRKIPDTLHGYPRRLHPGNISIVSTPGLLQKEKMAWNR
jgi:hypothetical protein